MIILQIPGLKFQEKLTSQTGKDGKANVGLWYHWNI